MCPVARGDGEDHVSVSALSDRGVRPAPAPSTPSATPSFSIRSFGSWGEAGEYEEGGDAGFHVSVSALSDRGVRPGVQVAPVGVVEQFQYPLFRIVG